MKCFNCLILILIFFITLMGCNQNSKCKKFIGSYSKVQTVTNYSAPDLNIITDGTLYYFYWGDAIEKKLGCKCEEDGILKRIGGMNTEFALTANNDLIYNGMLFKRIK